MKGLLGPPISSEAATQKGMCSTPVKLSTVYTIQSLAGTVETGNASFMSHTQ